MKSGDLVEYIRDEHEAYAIGEAKRKFYIILYDETFIDKEYSWDVWWCIPINFKYGITWIRQDSLRIINEI